LRAACLYGFLVVVLAGAADEWHQSWVPGRQASGADLLADAVGAALAVALAWCCHRWGSRSRWEWLKL
jgi:VanZ family protein